MTTKKLDVWTEGDLKQNREDGLSASDTLCTEEKKTMDISTDDLALESLLTDCGATSVSQLRWVLSHFDPRYLRYSYEICPSNILILFPFTTERRCSG